MMQAVTSFGDLRDKIAGVSFVKATSDRNLVSSGLPKFIYI